MKTTNDNYVFIEDILLFVNSHRLPKSLVALEKMISNDDLRIVSIKLLGWLKYQHASHQKRALKLKNDYKWCADFQKWLSNDENLRKIFAVNKNEVDFQNTVSNDEREIIRDLINKEYRPPLMKKGRSG